MPPSGCLTRTPGRLRTARRNRCLVGLPGDLRLTPRAIGDGISFVLAPGSRDLPSFPSVLARQLPHWDALSACPRAVQLAKMPAHICCEGRPCQIGNLA